MEIATGDRVQVTSIVFRKPHGLPRPPSPIGTVEGFEGTGVRVRFDALVNGVDNCLASRAECVPQP